ncbi:MAG: caspase family protein [Microvirga sp.]
MILRHVVATAFLLLASFGAGAARAEPRLALVIGQGAYAAGELPTAVNDAALVGQTLTSAGFEVVQGRDLNQGDLRRIIRDFLDGVQTATPDTTVVIYVAGHALQVEGEDYLVPTDARIARESDIPIEGYRVSDIIRSLSATPGATRLVILDAARGYPLPPGGQGLARGLAIVEPPPSFLVAFSAAPGAVAPEGQGPYGAYATALVEMMREPGIDPAGLFARVRLRVHEITRGRQTPWHAANLNAPFTFFEPVEATAAAPVRERRIASASAEDAYSFAVEQDTIQAYQEFLRAYPGHPLAGRVKLLLAARREAVIWRRTVLRNSPEAYWTYLRRYPNGPHTSDARRRLTRLSVPVAPPPDFDEVAYRDVPAPLPGEVIEIRETVYVDTDLPPPPRAPVYLLPERDEYITRLEAPPPAPARGILPIPIPIPIPLRARAPAEFRPPIAPLTPQGPVTIPLAAPPLQARPGAPSAGARPGQFAPQPQAGPAQPGVPGQPGLRGPITPLVQQQPQPAAGAPSAGAPEASAPAASPPAAASGAPARPSSLPPGTAPGQPRGPGAAGTRPGAIGTGAPPGAAPQPSPGAIRPGPGGPGAAGAAGVPGPRPGAITPAPGAYGTPGSTPAAGQPGASAPTPGSVTAPAPAATTATTASPGAATAPARQGARQPSGGSLGQGAGARGPGSPAGEAGAASPDEMRRRQLGTQGRAPGAARPAEPGIQATPGAAAPRPPAPRTQPPPEGGAAGIQRVARPTPPDAPRATPPQAAPAAAVQRPPPPIVAQPPRPAAPAPGAPPAQPAAHPAAAAPRPAAAPPRPQPGGPPKCVLPNGQPCPPPGARP